MSNNFKRLSTNPLTLPCFVTNLLSLVANFSTDWVQFCQSLCLLQYLTDFSRVYKPINLPEAPHAGVFCLTNYKNTISSFSRPIVHYTISVSVAVGCFTHNSNTQVNCIKLTEEFYATFKSYTALFRYSSAQTNGNSLPQI